MKSIKSFAGILLVVISAFFLITCSSGNGDNGDNGDNGEVTTCAVRCARIGEVDGGYDSACLCCPVETPYYWASDHHCHTTKDGTAGTTLTIHPKTGITLELNKYQKKQIATATGGSPSYTFKNDTFMNGTPPHGMTIGTDGYLTGTPTVKGQSTFGVCVKDLAADEVCGTVTVYVEEESTDDCDQYNALASKCGTQGTGGDIPGIFDGYPSPTRCGCPTNTYNAGSQGNALGEPSILCHCK